MLVWEWANALPYRGSASPADLPRCCITTITTDPMQPRQPNSNRFGFPLRAEQTPRKPHSSPGGPAARFQTAW